MDHRFKLGQKIGTESPCAGSILFRSVPIPCLFSGVEIGLKSVTCLTFGKGEILALFHCFGNFSARKEQFNRKLTGYAKISAERLWKHGAILSGPELLLEGF